MFSSQTERPAPHELMDALRILVGGHNQAEREVRARRCRDAILGGEYNLDGLFVARDGSGRPGGAALMQVMPGALGVAWAPRGDSPALADAAAHAACTWLRTRGVKVCQAFATLTDKHEMLPLKRNGFRRVTQLVYLSRPVGATPDGEDHRASPVQCIPDPVGRLDGRERLLLETHAGTLDCPELNAPRTPDEILAAFVPGAAANCCWWHTIVAATGPVGVLLFDCGEEPSSLQLAYLGVAPRARRRRIATASLAAADRIAAAGGYRTVSLSVDARNEPAMALYLRNGFQEMRRQEVYLKDLGTPSE